jgi:deoxyhypusine synthase
LSNKKLLKKPVEHVDIKAINSIPIIDAMRKMSFSSRDIARGTDILNTMISDRDCTIILTIAGSTSAAGCMQVYVDMVKSHMVDVIVSTGASIVDMDFFEALGYRHYQGTSNMDDGLLRENYIDRIYDTFIDEDELQVCDSTICEIADSLKPGIYSSREFIKEMGKYLKKNAEKKDSLVQAAYENEVPIFCPAFSDSSAGFGLVLHQEGKKEFVSIDCVKDFRELTEIKIRAKKSGLFMVGGGVPKNFAQDAVICAELLGHDVPMHSYAVQITVADERDGALSGSTLKEASSWGKVKIGQEQMIFAEATTVVPLMISYLYHKGDWKKRQVYRYNRIF